MKRKQWQQPPEGCLYLETKLFHWKLDTCSRACEGQTKPEHVDFYFFSSAAELSCLLPSPYLAPLQKKKIFFFFSEEEELFSKAVCVLGCSGFFLKLIWTSEPEG